MSCTILSDKVTEAYARPGEDSLIDCIHPETGLTFICGETFEQVRERYPNAERINIADWNKAIAAKQDEPVIWQEITEEKYNYYLEVLPPAAYARGFAGGFLVGEPWDHHARKNGRA